MRIKELQSVTFPSGVSFTKGKAAMVDTLFQPIQGKTALGYYTQRKGSQRAYFYDVQGKLLFGLVAKGASVQLQTATDNGRFWPCMDSLQSALLGLRDGDWKTREAIAREVLA